MSVTAQEFNISVTPLGGQDEYLVRTEWVAPGVPLAEEQVRWPVEKWLAEAKQLMNDPLVGLLQGNGNSLGMSSSMDLLALGQELYDALFQKSLLNSWERAQGIAENRQMVLRLRLGLKGTRLPRLPWEVLHAGDRPLATGTDVAFSRYELTTGLRSQSPTLSGAFKQPLKILMVVAGPTDQETLELKQEANQLQEELRHRSYSGAGSIQLTILEQPGREHLTQALEQGQYQIFHYAGHSNLGAAGGALYLVSDKTGLTETLSGDDLAGLLVNNGVQMAVFNSCRGAYTASEAVGETGREQNLIQALVKRRIPGVLAMAERIPDDVALTLTRLFYRNLNQGYPIDLSLSRARQGLISAYGSNQLYWALPVLYLDPKFDGFLIGSSDPKELEKRLTLPDPYEGWTDDEEEALFTATASLNSSSFLDDDEDAVAGIYDDLGSADSDYEEDFAVVSELLSQLPNTNSMTGPEVPLSGSQTLLPDSAKNSASAQGMGGEAKAKNQQPTVLQNGSHAAQNLTSTIQESKPQNAGPSKLLVSGRLPVQTSKDWRSRLKRVPLIWWLLGATSILAIAILGWLFWQNRGPQPDELIGTQNPSVPSQPNLGKNVNLSKADTLTVTSVAIQQFSQGNLVAGSQAVEELLKPGRNAISDAEAALAAVPSQQVNSPKINFLRGRVAWQSVQQPGNKKYSIDDAIRYWEYARKQEANSPQYLSALGFAYYAQGKYDAANNAWFDALYNSSQNQATAANTDTPKETLNIYAGLALGLRKSAQNQPADKRSKLLTESQKMRQKVVTDNPIDFQPDNLSKNWLWTEKAIQDWRSLLQQKDSNASVTPVPGSGAGKNVGKTTKSPSKNSSVRH